MPEKRIIDKARAAKKKGHAPSTQAGAFVHEEIEKIRRGEHGARNAKQAIAIGLSKARRAGVALKAPRAGRTSSDTRKKAARDYDRGKGAAPKRKPSAKRAAASKEALKREPRAAASHTALSRQARAASKKRSVSERSTAARKASSTKGPTVRRKAARKAARTRAKRA